MKKRFLAMFLALCLTLALLPTAALAAKAGDTTVADNDGYYNLSNPISKVDTVPEDIEAFIRTNGSDTKNINGVYVVPAGTTITNSNPEGGVAYLASDGVGEDGSVTVTAGKYMIVWGDEFHVFYADKAPGADSDFQILEGGVLDEYTGSGGAVTIPGNITGIAEQAFINCVNVTSVNIPNSVTSIDQYAFYGCTGLRSITIPNSVTSLSEGVFSHCSGLDSITIPSSVTSMGKWLFLDCTNLKDIYFDGSEAQWKAIKVEATGNDALKNATIHYNSTMPTQPTTPDQPDSSTAHASAQTVTVDGKPVEFQMYALKDASGNDTNYIKLRDMAYVLNSTKAQFSVGYNAQNKTITATTGAAYEEDGTEMKATFGGADKEYTKTTLTIQLDGKPVQLEAITLTDDAGGGYNYCKVKDLGQTFNFNVDWNAGVGIYIESDKPYSGQ